MAFFARLLGFRSPSAQDPEEVGDLRVSVEDTTNALMLRVLDEKEALWEEGRRNQLTFLPDDLVKYIFEFCDLEVMTRFAITCKYAFALTIVRADEVCRQILLGDYHESIPEGRLAGYHMLKRFITVETLDDILQLERGRRYLRGVDIKLHPFFLADDLSNDLRADERHPITNRVVALSKKNTLEERIHILFQLAYMKIMQCKNLKMLYMKNPRSKLEYMDRHLGNLRNLESYSVPFTFGGGILNENLLENLPARMKRNLKNFHMEFLGEQIHRTSIKPANIQNVYRYINQILTILSGIEKITINMGHGIPPIREEQLINWQTAFDREIDGERYLKEVKSIVEIPGSNKAYLEFKMTRIEDGKRISVQLFFDR